MEEEQAPNCRMALEFLEKGEAPSGTSKNRHQHESVASPQSLTQKNSGKDPADKRETPKKEKGGQSPTEKKGDKAPTKKEGGTPKRGERGRQRP